MLAFNNNLQANYGELSRIKIHENNKSREQTSKMLLQRRIEILNSPCDSRSLVSEGNYSPDAATICDAASLMISRFGLYSLCEEINMVL